MLMLAIGNITYAILMAGYARSGTPDASMRIWTWAKVIQGCAFFAFWMRPELPPAFGAFISNGLLIVAAVGELAAYSLFMGYRWRRRLVVIGVLCELLLAAAVLGNASLVNLAGLMSLIVAAIAGLNAFFLIGAGVTLLRFIIGVPNLLISVGFLWRAHAGFTEGTLTVFSPGLPQTLLYLGAYFLLIVNGFGFLLLCKQKDERRLRELATTDGLTGLINRHAFLGEAERAHSLARRLGKPLTLLMLDIDHFKGLNDRYGHAFGDQALRVFAQAAQSALRRHDVLGRLGGEEFAVFLPETGLGDAIDAAERLRLAVASARLDSGGEAVAMTVSIGVAELAVDDMVSAALLRADTALYAAKRKGRNRVEAAFPVSASSSGGASAVAHG
jgi:diguanylate cyclase (GGDEF)-like protein